MAAALARPGVEVVQVFRSTSPTVIVPTLVPCIVGVCKQIIDVIEKSDSGSSSLNGDALITLPALLLAKAASGSPAKYTGLNGLSLTLSVNNGPGVVITFADVTATGLSPAAMVLQINKAFTTAGLTSATSETVGSDRFRIRTLAVGEFQSIQVTAGSSAVLTALGVAVGQTFVGLGAYDQHKIDIHQSNFPDPRGNLSSLAVEDSTVRVFLALGTGAELREVLRTESFLRRGGTASAAVLTGSIDLTTLVYGAGGSLDGEAFVVKIDDATTNVTTTFVAPANTAAVASQINTAMNSAGYGSSVASIVANNLVLTSPTTGVTSKVKIISGTTAVGSSSLVDLGFAVSQEDVGEAGVAAVDDGNGDAVTPLIRCNLATFATAGAAASVEGTADITAGGLYGGGGTLNGTTLILSDGRAAQTVTFVGADLANVTALLLLLNGFFGAAGGGGLSFVQGGTGGNKLVISSVLLGQEGYVEVVGGTALTALGLTAAKTRGTAFPPAAGDQLYVDGELLGTIVQVAPGGLANTLKIDQQVAIDSNLGNTYYIVAKSLSATQTATRPSADLAVASNGVVTIKHELLRDTTGAPITGKASVYLSYRAVRKDVTAVSSNPGLLGFDNTTQLESSLAPVSVDNPLALGLYFALLNAPGSRVTGIGVDAVSADATYGTVEAFTRAAEFLEAFEVYAVAPLTHDSSVAQVFNTHATVMSDPANKGERITLFNSAAPTNKLDTLVASGTNGSSNAGTTFDTGVVSLPALLLNAGIDPTTTIPVSEGLFLDIASDAKKYSIQSISGGVITIRTTFASGENDDAFYATTDLNDPPLTSILVNEAFAVRIRGASLTNADGTIDKQAMAETYQGIAMTYLNRRFWHVVADKTAATLDGLEQQLEGFYLCAGIAGMIGQLPPQQSFTNFPMTGFTQVTGTNGYFSEKQLDIIAGGGNWIVVQDTQGAPLTSRMALTSDLTSIETRTDSITKVVDFAAKFLRRGLRNFIGRFNITQGFLDSLGHVIQGLLGFLVETGVLIGANLNNLIQDEDAPDTVLVDITLDVPFPCNYIRLTLVV